MTTLVGTSPSLPRLRGALHAWAVFPFAIAGVFLVLRADTQAFWPVLAYALSVVSCLGTSSLYHRVGWSPRWYARMRRMDHAAIMVLIVGTYTPFALVSLRGQGIEVIFAALCAVALLGVIIALTWTSAPKWVRAVVYLVVGWMGALAIPQLLDTIGVSGIALLALGGVLYSAGALVYALKRPDPLPRTFGYHEIFHAFVIAAAAAHFVVIAFWVVR